jgi:hypothetical protein
MKINQRANAPEGYALASKLVLAVTLACAFTLSAVTGASARKSFPKPFAITKSGPVLGITVNGVDEFLGIPYAAPPVGSLRWMPPKPFGKFSGPFQANQFGSECTQSGTGSEDCLFLNVYEPTNSEPGSAMEQAGDVTASKSKKKPTGLPVMVWIHGGGLTGGAGSLYDPTPLVNAEGSSSSRSITASVCWDSLPSPGWTPNIICWATMGSWISNSRLSGFRRTSRPLAAIRRK